MKIRVTGTPGEIRHYTKKLENGTDYSFVKEPSEMKRVEGGVDEGKYRKHFTVREEFRQKKKKKKEQYH